MKIGDKIALLDEDLKGLIKKIEKDFIVIEDEYGFERKVQPEEIVLENAEIYKSQPITSKVEPTEKPTSKPAKDETMLLDLHFNQLVDNPDQYSSWDRLFLQKQKLEETLAFCRENRIKRLEVVHGLGEGVVQDMVLKVLRSQTGLEFEDDDFFKNQSGSVLVIFN